MLMTVYDHQIRQLAELEIEKFYRRTIKYLFITYPDWAAKKGQSKVRQCITDIIEFGRKYGIKKEASLLLLLDFEIREGLLEKLPFDAVTMSVLENKDRIEKTKMDVIKYLYP